MAPPCMAQRLIDFPKWMVYRNTKHVTWPMNSGCIGALLWTAMFVLFAENGSSNNKSWSLVLWSLVIKHGWLLSRLFRGRPFVSMDVNSGVSSAYRYLNLSLLKILRLLATGASKGKVNSIQQLYQPASFPWYRQMGILIVPMGGIHRKIQPPIINRTGWLVAAHVAIPCWGACGFWNIMLVGRGSLVVSWRSPHVS